MASRGDAPLLQNMQLLDVEGAFPDPEARAGNGTPNEKEEDVL